MAYNDEARIAQVVRQAHSSCGNVLVCDDGSTDRTSDKARAAGAHVIRHETRQGKRSNMADLANEVVLKSPSYFILLEREGFPNAGEIPFVLDPVLKDEADIAVATGVEEGSWTPASRQ